MPDRVRAFLDSIYRGCGAVAGVFLASIAVLVATQIVGRLFGVLVPGADDLAGFSLVATSFLALPYTLKAGGHIRVALLLQRLAPARRRAFELWCLAAGAFVSAYFAFYAVDLAWGSYVFGDMSQGVLPIPLWAPQSGMALGLVVLAIAFLDELSLVLLGKPPSYQKSDELLQEVGDTSGEP